MVIYLVLLLVGALGVAIAFYAIREDQQNKEIQRLVDRAIDKDNDGWILEGTALQRKAPSKPKAKAQAKPKAKAKPAAKKKAVAKKKPVKKTAVKKKSTASKPKKKAVAKKKSR
jgi:hypothetical protein